MNYHHCHNNCMNYHHCHNSIMVLWPTIHKLPIIVWYYHYGCWKNMSCLICQLAIDIILYTPFLHKPLTHQSKSWNTGLASILLSRIFSLSLYSTSSRHFQSWAEASPWKSTAPVRSEGRGTGAGTLTADFWTVKKTIIHGLKDWASTYHSLNNAQGISFIVLNCLSFMGSCRDYSAWKGSGCVWTLVLRISD